MKKNETNWEIDQYNQYGLEEPRSGTKNKTTCPLCSHTRRNKHERCAWNDWDSGHGFCHHCGGKYKLHTWKKAEPLKSWYAYEALPNGRTKYFHDDGTTTTC